jgi:hypothetical protein
VGLSDIGVATGSNVSRTMELTQKGTEKDSIQIKALDRGVLMRKGLEKGENALEAAQAILPNLLAHPMSTPGNIEFADAREAVVIEGSYYELARENHLRKDDRVFDGSCKWSWTEFHLQTWYPFLGRDLSISYGHRD